MGERRREEKTLSGFRNLASKENKFTFPCNVILICITVLYSLVFTCFCIADETRSERGESAIGKIKGNTLLLLSTLLLNNK